MPNNYNKKLIINRLVQLMLVWITTYPTATFAQDLTEIQIANEYLLKGQKQKAIDSYKQLAKKNENIPFIHNDYLNLLLDQSMFKDAETYVDRLLRNENKLTYQLDLGIIYQRQGDLPKSDRYLKNLIRQSSQDIPRLKQISDYLLTNNLIAYSIDALQQARETSNTPTIFTLELANLFRLSGKNNEMVNEYLNYIAQTPGNLGYIKNLLQVLLTKPEELQALEGQLYLKVQSSADNENYAELLIWVNLQQRNFLGAFVQARAFDKRFKKETSKTLEIAQIAFNNKSYEAAEKAYTFVMKEYANTSSFLSARLGLLKTKEARLKEQLPVKIDSVRSMIASYDKFIETYPDNPNSFEAIENKALLFAYYLDDKEKAISILTSLVANPKVNSPLLKSKCKLELGDLYLFKYEPWEASLLYSQVEKTNKETVLGYDAKLKNAKLSYFIGDFKLAEEHLDILKKATSREIANDALELSLRIKENTASDTLATSLKEYASIEMLLNQNKLDAAITKLDALKKIEGDGDSLRMKSSTLLDDIYWLEANTLLKQGDFERTISLLRMITKFYSQDVLSDDAYFLEAEVFEQHLNKKSEAMEIYRDFLSKYPGSVYASEARKRYRELRGDFTNANSIN
jgi:hypothetical protein